MSTLALMYHATPAVAEKPLDVPISVFREQIDRLIDGGVTFIPFARVGDPNLLAHGRYVAVTFDDGHMSNTAAVEYLVDRGVRPTLFIVRDWAEVGIDQEGRNGFMRPAELRRISLIAALGVHGETHQGFSSLVGEALDRELENCLNFLGELSGERPIELALPGGDGNEPRVLDQCRSNGCTVIGSSVFDINTAQAASYARTVIHCQHDGEYPTRLAQRPDLTWAALRLAKAGKRIITSACCRRP